MPRLAKVLSWVAWSAITALYAGWLIAGQMIGSVGCEEPAGSSNYGDASWSLWPPGTTCSYHSVDLTYLRPGLHVSSHTDRPPIASGVVLALLVVWLSTNVALSHRKRRSSAPPGQ